MILKHPVALKNARLPLHELHALRSVRFDDISTSQLSPPTSHPPPHELRRIMWRVGVAYSLHELHALRSDPSLIR